ncbi:MAG: RsmF rRNA methyltransferase first C-terminal domain-containing protein [Blautia sp.]
MRECLLEYFDRIMVDAPCSGEGMFRKNEQACEEWSPENVQICAARQQEILACAASMLRPGGRMVYSTCTFAPEENEGTISRFLEQHPQFHIVPVKKYPGMADGVAAWTKHPAAEIGDTIRLFPHHLHGEGHFVAVLEKEGTVSENYRGYCANGEEKPLAKGESKAYLAGLQEVLGKIPADDAGRLLLFGEQLYLMPEHMPATRRLHVLRRVCILAQLKRTGWNRHTHWRLQFLRRKHATAGICLWMKHARIWPGRRFRQKGRRAGI